MLPLTMNEVEKTYDTFADEYVRRIYHELEGKPLDRELLERFVKSIPEGGTICDLGYGPGHVAGFLRYCRKPSIG